MLTELNKYVSYYNITKRPIYIIYLIKNKIPFSQISFKHVKLMNVILHKWTYLNRWSSKIIWGKQRPQMETLKHDNSEMSSCLKSINVISILLGELKKILKQMGSKANWGQQRSHSQNCVVDELHTVLGSCRSSLIRIRNLLNLVEVNVQLEVNRGQSLKTF